MKIKSPYVIGVDLGGTNVRAAAVYPGGRMKARVRTASFAGKGYRRVVAEIRKVIKDVIWKQGGQPAALGIASAGAIDASKMTVTSSPNFPDWKNVSLAEDAAKGLKIPVALENDANAAALGEAWLGAGKGWPVFTMFTLGTGVGGGIVSGGQVWEGANGMAGEVGHIKIHPGGRLCGCGARGCLETAASAKGVAITAAANLDLRHGQWLYKASLKSGKKIDAELVAKGAKQRDALCRKIMRGAGADLGVAMAQITLITGITRFIIGGGMAPALPYMRAAMRKSALENAYTLDPKNLKIKQAALGDDAGILGAAKAAFSLTGD